jgi:HD-GYP domain-containing protein (c-di-GMP phosphodiesterase class II)
VKNAQLRQEIEQLFEGFVAASVTAIEARDPVTSGHSGRVADLTVGLAEAVNATPNGTYGDLALHGSAAARGPLREPAARFRQGGRPGTGAGEGQEAGSRAGWR